MTEGAVEGTTTDPEASTDDQAAPAPAKGEAAPASAADRPQLAEVQGWAGHKLDELGGATVGKVEAAFVDEETELPEWLLIRLGRFGHHTLVPAREAVGGVGRVWVPYAREVIRKSPKADAGSPLSRERELELLAHYGITGDAGRAGEVSSRAAEAITSRPAS